MTFRSRSLASDVKKRTRLAAAAAILLLASTIESEGAEDKYNITAAEHAACDGDVERLCGAAYPDPDKVIACMRANRTRLDPTCQASFEAGMRKRHLPL